MSSLIQKIVVPIDFSDASEHAARYACTLARNLGSSVYLIHVLEQPVRGPVSTFEAGGTGERLYRGARERLAALAGRLGALRITTEVRSGKVAEEINDCAIAYGADLVVMSTRGLTGLPHLLLGSVAEHVVEPRAARCWWYATQVRYVFTGRRHRCGNRKSRLRRHAAPDRASQLLLRVLARGFAGCELDHHALPACSCFDQRGGSSWLPVQ